MAPISLNLAKRKENDPVCHHDIEERCQVADRVLIMTARRALFNTRRCRSSGPRHLDSPGNSKKRYRIFQLMGMSLRVGRNRRVEAACQAVALERILIKGI